MGPEVRFHLLGPLTVTVGGQPLPLGGAKQRVLLAHLLLNANRTVPPGQLVDTIWPREPPTSATANLQTYVWRLRRLLPDTLLRTHCPGYSLAVDPDAVDAHRFTRLVGEAERADHPEAALTLLAEAERSGAASRWRTCPPRPRGTPNSAGSSRTGWPPSRNGWPCRCRWAGTTSRSPS